MIDGRVVGKPVDHASRGRLRALYEWLKPATPSPHLPSSPASAPDRGDLPARIGQYAIERKLGQGGMGVVYAARDERLKRTVALKMMSSLAHDERARTRFWREARVAASVNHPNVCQIYEISEDHGELFIAMELLEGEALSERLRNGPLSIADALPIEFGILAALSALHARGIVHRDLKPVERVPHASQCEAARLRLGAPRAGAVAPISDQSHTQRDSVGHSELHGTGTTDQWGGRQPMRSLCRRCDPVRAACGSSGVWGPNGRRCIARHAP